jgi:hypothetical protein
MKSKFSKILFLILLIFIVYLFFPIIWEDRIDVSLGAKNNIRLYHYQVKDFQVKLISYPLVSGDNGSAQIDIYIDNVKIYEMLSFFNYDTLTDVPAAYVSFMWKDADFYQDLVITNSNGV